ncbi:MAG TPA: nitrogen fixation protein NifH [Anaerolineae bacterium]|nr:nitrogen fixation protein NifH [Anaerolineae bacterium]
MVHEGALPDTALSWLLEPESPGVRYLALRDLMGRLPGDSVLDEARREAHARGPISTILEAMDPLGFWVQPGAGYNPKYRSTVWSIISLAQLGASVSEDERIGRACAYLLDHAFCPGGQLGLAGSPSSTVDCLQGNLCWSLLELGFEDPRLQTAYDWMARTVTGEGIARATQRDAPVRYYAGKCGPGFCCGANDKQACAWGAVKVLLALSRLPVERRTPQTEGATRCAVDFFLSIDPASAAYPTWNNQKPSGSWFKFGFPVFYVTDLLQLVEALVAVGYGRDPRLARSVEFILGKRDAMGSWPLEYDYAGKTWVEYGAKKKPNKWVTLRALRVLRQIEIEQPGLSIGARQE